MVRRECFALHKAITGRKKNSIVTADTVFVPRLSDVARSHDANASARKNAALFYRDDHFYVIRKRVLQDL